MRHVLILADQAIKSALSKDWSKAVEINLEILKYEKDNIPALNRLANAYIELKKPKQAKRILKKVLRFDKENSVASKNLKRISKPAHQQEPPKIIKAFIKEPGRTKTIQVISDLSPSNLAHLKPSEALRFKTKGRQLLIEDSGGHEVAKLGGELAKDFKSYLKRKIEFKLTLIAIENKALTILAKSAKPIFLLEESPPQYRPYTSKQVEEHPLDFVEEES